MSNPEQEWSDIEIRTMLHMRRQGASFGQISVQIGRSRQAVGAVLRRATIEADKVDCACEKPENKDGSGWDWPLQKTPATQGGTDNV